MFITELDKKRQKEENKRSRHVGRSIDWQCAQKAAIKVRDARKAFQDKHPNKFIIQTFNPAPERPGGGVRGPGNPYSMPGFMLVKEGYTHPYETESHDQPPPKKKRATPPSAAAGKPSTSTSTSTSVNQEAPYHLPFAPPGYPGYFTEYNQHYYPQQQPRMVFHKPVRRSGQEQARMQQLMGVSPQLASTLGMARQRLRPAQAPNYPTFGGYRMAYTGGIIPGMVQNAEDDDGKFSDVESEDDDEQGNRNDKKEYEKGQEGTVVQEEGEDDEDNEEEDGSPEKGDNEENNNVKKEADDCIEEEPSSAGENGKKM